MIQYNTRTWGLSSIFTLRGSVFPKATAWALPAAIMCAIFNYTLRNAWTTEFQQVGEASFALTLLSSYNGVLGFLVVFRSQLAYARWWEGGTLLQQLRGEWFNAYSSLIAFCTVQEDKREQVESFQQLLVRLMSLLYGFALQQVSTMEQKDFEVFDLDGLDVEHLTFLKESVDKCEITLQWIQRMVVQHAAIGTIEISPPILSRVFQELSRGIVNLNNARKISEFPFPFPWPQMITTMLMIQVLITPLIAGVGIESRTIGCGVTFLVIFASFGIHYIAQELENPYGDDPNDLPLREMQLDMNQSLMRLLHPMAQTPPRFEYRHRVSWSHVRQTGSIDYDSTEGPLCMSRRFSVPLERTKVGCCFTWEKPRQTSRASKHIRMSHLSQTSQAASEGAASWRSGALEGRDQTSQSQASVDDNLMSGSQRADRPASISDVTADMPPSSQALRMTTGQSPIRDHELPAVAIDEDISNVANGLPKAASPQPSLLQRMAANAPRDAVATDIEGTRATTSLVHRHHNEILASQAAGSSRVNLLPKELGEDASERRIPLPMPGDGTRRQLFRGTEDGVDGINGHHGSNSAGATDDLTLANIHGSHARIVALHMQLSAEVRILADLWGKVPPDRRVLELV
mmetsp:Transcript_69749/g.167449  ORF Transcript_69749/g.167449 Transcript_69749/m.167449 type:complete len:630 (+) Transcript_69749:67-1956(+)